MSRRVQSQSNLLDLDVEAAVDYGRAILDAIQVDLGLTKEETIPALMAAVELVREEFTVGDQSRLEYEIGALCDAVLRYRQDEHSPDIEFTPEEEANFQDAIRDVGEEE